MARIFDGEVWVHYGQAYVFAGDNTMTDMGECFAGQSNGLCGAASPGLLFLVTGLHTGTVPMAVERSDAAPPLDGTWEEVVEVSLHADSPEVVLQGWGGSSSADLDLGEAGDYRVRYCARGMDAANAQDTRRDDDPVADAYLLQFWPAPPEADVVVTETSENAAYWHRSARALPSQAQMRAAAAQREADAERQAARAREENIRRVVREDVETNWGGRAPTGRLRDVGVVATSVARTDRDLADDLAALDPGTQRDGARWAARRAFEVAGIDTLDWARAALDALDDGRPLPPPFAGDLTEAFALVAPPGPSVLTATVSPVPPTSRSVVESRPPTAAAQPPPAQPPPAQPPPAQPPPAWAARPPGMPAPLPPGRRVHRPSMAIPALPAATAADPLYALFDALHHACAAFDDRRPELIAEVRARYGRE